MKPIQIISQDLFDKVRSRFTNLEMGDETGAVTIDPAQARFFDFDFVNEGVNLGRVSISLNDLGSLKIYYSQGITENQDDNATQMWYDFLKEMRLFSMRRLLRFDTRDIAKNNLDKNDFQHLAATQGPKEEPDMTMNESRWTPKSSSKTSRAVQGKTEIIVRHGHPVDEEYAGSRSQKKNIKAIFIQNRDGERFKYPFIHTAGAFAMAQHVDHGGAPHDPAGKAIVKMSEQIAQLGEFQRHVQRSSLHDDAMGITDRALGRMNELKMQIANLGKRHHYENWINEFAPSEEEEMVLDAVAMEEYKSKFTQTNFQEELASFFPLLDSIMREANTVDLESYVNEATCPKCDCTPCECDDEEEVKESAFAQFEEWAEATEQGKLTDDQIMALKQALSDLEASGNTLQLGPDGQTSIQFFSELGLDDADLAEKLKAATELDPSGDGVEVLKIWAQENYPELLVALGMSETGEEPAPEAPPMEPAMAPAEMPVAEGTDDGASMVQEVAKIVKSFYNKDNPDVGPFRGGEGIALDVEKQISEKFGEEAGAQARQMAEMFMDKLTTEWTSRHGQTGPVDSMDGLARLKELLGNVKNKVECYSPGGEKSAGGLDMMRELLDSVKSKVEAFAPTHAGQSTDEEQDEAYNPNSASAEHRRGIEASHEKRLKDKAAAGDKSAQSQSDALAQKKERMKNDYNDRMERENVELESIMKLAGLGEGSGSKEKQKTPYRDISGPEYKAAAEKQKQKMAKDKAAEPGKALLAKKK